MQNKFTIGIDYGTDSVRALIVDTQTGKEAGTAVFEYPRWKKAQFCNASENRFRQHPLDYIEGLEFVIKEALKQAPAGTAENIAAISVDTTGSTPVAVDREGIPLALKKEFTDDPDAMFILWKDHTAVKEAEEINHVCRTWGGTDFTKYEGGIYSSEWFWAKILHTLRKNEKVKHAAWSWVEHCDWVPALLTGNTDPLVLKRGRCAAGHKAMWHPEWHGLPPEDFLVKVDPVLEGLRERLYTETYTSDQQAGNISPEWASRLGIPETVVVGVGAFDAHLGAVGGEIQPYYLSKVMGTSTCDMLVAPENEVGNTTVRGICGQVDGSITPGMIGLEAGQSAFGDIYAWFKNVLMWPIENVLAKSEYLTSDTKQKIKDEIAGNMIKELSQAASDIPAGAGGEIALDWMNGRRTPDANQELKGAIANLTLGSDAPRIFRTLVESTAYGARRIVERFQEEGARIDGIIALGGVAKKSPFVMQTVADVLNMPIKVVKSEETCALGSAMAASVAAGVHKTFKAAQEHMGQGFEKEYTPNAENAKIYDDLYEKYKSLGKFIEEDFIR